MTIATQSLLVVRAEQIDTYEIHSGFQLELIGEVGIKRNTQIDQCTTWGELAEYFTCVPSTKSVWVLLRVVIPTVGK